MYKLGNQKTKNTHIFGPFELFLANLLNIPKNKKAPRTSCVYDACTSMEHTYPSYTQIIFQMLLTHWVKFKPKNYGQILHQCVSWSPPCAPSPQTNDHEMCMDKQMDVLFEDCITCYWQPQSPADKLKQIAYCSTFSGWAVINFFFLVLIL
jgi:hypothetical protein